MRFTEMTIDNFGPYYEKASVNLDSGKDGVIIFWGNNGRGKTTLLNAFRFALYGEIKKRNNAEADYHGLINVVGSSEGKNYFEITLKIKDNNDVYELIRRYELREGKTSYSTKKEDYVFSTALIKNTSILSKQEADKYIANLLPIDVSRFFLFDGELLQEYETLLDDGDQAGEKIKTSIEQILGLPYLINSKNDVSKFSEVIEAAKKKAIQADKKFEKYSAQYNETKAQIDSHAESVRRAKLDLQDLLGEKADIERKLSETQLARGWMTKIKEYESDTKIRKQANDSFISQIKTLTKEAWKFQIKSKIDEIIKELTDKIQVLKDKESKTKINNNLIEMIKDAISTCQCPLCTQEINESLAKLLKDKEIEIQSNDADTLTEEESKLLLELQSRLRSLSSLKTTDYNDDIAILENRIDENLIAIVDDDNNIKATKEKISNLDFDKSMEDNILALPKLYSDCELKINNLKKAINEEEAKIQDLTKNINDLWKIISQNGGQDLQEITRKSDRINEITNIFAEAIDLFRSKLKQNVQKDATELFKKLSAEKDYERLEINDNYGLSILNSSGMEAPNRSAGYEHLVALALIGALHKNAPLKGPIIMDSPFGRLDPNNKKNVCSVLPDLADQVVLLMYEDEIDAEMIRKLLDNKLIGEHNLVRVESMKTRIE